MKSTGETMGIDSIKEKAIMKSYLGNYPKLCQVGAILVSLTDNDKGEICPKLKKLKIMGYTFFATEYTHLFLKSLGIKSTPVNKVQQSVAINNDDILSILDFEDIRMVFNTSLEDRQSKEDCHMIRKIAISRNIPCFTRKESILCLIDALSYDDKKILETIALQDTSFDS